MSFRGIAGLILLCLSLLLGVFYFIRPEREASDPTLEATIPVQGIAAESSERQSRPTQEPLPRVREKERTEVSPSVDVDNERKYEVFGCVTHPNGEAVSDVELYFYSASVQGASRTTSADDGAYSVLLDNAQIVGVFLRVHGYQLKRDVSKIGRLSDEMPRVRYDVTLPFPTVVRGAVIDINSGTGIPNMAVYLEQAIESSGVTAGAMFMTDESGEFKITSQFQGKVQLKALPKLTEEFDTLSEAYEQLLELTLNSEDGVRYEVRPHDVVAWPLASSFQELELASDYVTVTDPLLVGNLGTVQLEVRDANTEVPVKGVRPTIACPVRGVTLIAAPTDSNGITSLEYPPGRVTIRVSLNNVSSMEGKLDISIRSGEKFFVVARFPSSAIARQE